jgi:hypothetical protein
MLIYTNPTDLSQLIGYAYFVFQSQCKVHDENDISVSCFDTTQYVKCI